MKIKETKNFKIKEVAVSASYPNLAILPNDALTIKNINHTLEKLQIIRDDLAKPMFILSFYRDEKLNKAVNGATNSQHKYGTAVDFTISGANLNLVANYIYEKNYPFMDKIIYYPEQNFIHLTILKKGSNKYWKQ
ncbi:D-Ala-D-Ala carboxypeptidase family metallohydrolase [Cetobacterium sp. ZWU0022]|uniref:D-Ala-D-Ala carboxypeptidase family metallohydrolase n=1 Tax=Cetobacterium sp. ZWU0022 TaxID=1340502 RepID=UPI000691EDF7|nr:D-Ala-D-Ala carboxypeptidase family metallohydrolase [Cetobacterium sp. ZWU0022]